MQCPICMQVMAADSGVCTFCNWERTAVCPTCNAATLRNARYCAFCGTALTHAPVASTTNNASESGSQSGLRIERLPERRQLTVLFYDVVGSTDLAAHLDPEEYREIIFAIHRQTADLVTQLGGVVAEYLGDGALVYFGYPEAKEHQTEHAVQAALRLVTTVAETRYSHGRHAAVRAGVATGVVVVGTALKSAAMTALNAAGVTLNLAARLQAKAQPGQVLVDSMTYQLVQSKFEWRNRGPFDLKGFAAPVPGWQPLHSLRSDKRAPRRGLNYSPLPLVGRTTEMAHLAEAWQSACAHKGRVVLVRGEAGMGKSRLIEALLEMTTETAHGRILCYCLQQMQSSPLHPFINYIERTAEFGPTDTMDVKWTKLRRLLGTAPQHDDGIALIADLLRIYSRDLTRTPNLSPRQRRNRMGEVFRAHLAVLASNQPVLLVVEDVHWMDPTSLETTGQFLKVVSQLPVLLVMCFRPEFQPPWQANGLLETIDLKPLSTADSQNLIQAIEGHGNLDTKVVREIIERTDGVPLFIEEMTAALVEVDVQGAELQQWVAAVPQHRHGVPATLHASLSARLDRLGPAKTLAQICAALGRSVARKLLVAVADWEPSEFRVALRSLLESGLLYREPTAGDIAYTFKHALVQDMAYDTMLHETRRKLHRRIVSVYQTQFTSFVDIHPEILARHCTEAGMTEEGIAYWRRAGFWALERSAMIEAIAALESGLRLVKTMPPTAERFGIELEFEIASGKAMIASVGYAATATGEAFARARTLCSKLGNPPALLAVLHGQWTHALLRARIDTAQRHVNEIARAAEQHNDDMWMVMGCRFAGVTYYPMGQLLLARQELERGLKMFDVKRRYAYAALTVDDTRVVMLVYLAYALLYLGEEQTAREYCEEALTEALALGQPYSITHALVGAAFTELSIRQWDNAEAHLQQLLQLTREHGIAYYEAVGTVLKGACQAGRGLIEDGVATLERGVAAYRTTGSLLYLPTFAGYLADAYRVQGRHDLSMSLFNELTALIEQTNMRNDEAEVYRARAELNRALGDNAKASQDLAHAQAVATRQSCKLHLHRLAQIEWAA